MSTMPIPASLPPPPRLASPGTDPDIGPWVRRGADLAALRARVRHLESGIGSRTYAGQAYGDEAYTRETYKSEVIDRPSVPLGAAAIDAHLPGGGLPLGGLHEIEGARVEWDEAAATGFALALLARLCATAPAWPDGGPGGGMVLWATPWRDLYAPGLAAFGLDPGRLILAHAERETDVLWAMEEGLRCSRLIAVVGEVGALDRGAGRRLQLAAKAGGVTAFALRRQRHPARRAVAPSAAMTRWRIAPDSLTPSGANGPGRLLGRPRWQVELLRCRGAAPGQWQVEWDDATSGFAVAAPLRDGPMVAGPAPSGFARAGTAGPG